MRRQRPRVLSARGGRHSMGEGGRQHGALHRRAHGRRAEEGGGQDQRHQCRDARGRSAPGTMPAFVRQVPMAKAMHPDTLIAYAMNGEPIPLVHGAPLRAIIPGWEGAYCIKWLNTLNVIAKDSDSFWVVTGYRYPTRRVAPGAAVEDRK